MKPTKFTALSAGWNVNTETADFSSPSKDSEPNQIVVFGDRVKDGAISASITPISGQLDSNFGHEFRECAFVFRYDNREHFYLAGIGGFGVSFFIAKVSGLDWQLLADKGEAGSLKSQEPYHLRAEFTGDRITLFHNDVPILNVLDGTYSSGLCGLRTNRTEARFENVDIRKEVETGPSRTRYPASTGGSLMAPQIERRDQTVNKVFIGHGGSSVWRDLKDFLRDRLNLQWDEFNRESPAGLSVKDRLEEMLDQAGFAFLVLTAEDKHSDDTHHARENVVHEAGLFQGRLGFRRAIILLEEGCEEFSNVHGIQQIRFPKGNISAKFEEIRRVLEREKVIAS